MKKLVLFFSTLITLSGEAQVVITVPNTSDNSPVKQLLFGVNTANTFQQVSNTSTTLFKGLVSKMGVYSFYYPGGSVARLYHYSHNPSGFTNATTGYKTCLEQEEDLTSCNQTTIQCAQYNDDVASTGDSYQRQVDLCDLDGSGSITAGEPGLTLSLNMYFDRRNDDLGGMLNYYQTTFGNTNTRIDAIIMGSEIYDDQQKKNDTGSYYGTHSTDTSLMQGLPLYTTWTSTCGSFSKDEANQLDGYEQESDYKLQTVTNTVGGLLQTSNYDHATINSRQSDESSEQISLRES